MTTATMQLDVPPRCLPLSIRPGEGLDTIKRGGEVATRREGIILSLPSGIGQAIGERPWTISADAETRGLLTHMRD